MYDRITTLAGDHVLIRRIFTSSDAFSYSCTVGDYPDLERRQILLNTAADHPKT
jgi:hypothetical protein